jgi:hypothetical protein
MVNAEGLYRRGNCSEQLPFLSARRSRITSVALIAALLGRIVTTIRRAAPAATSGWMVSQHTHAAATASTQPPPGWTAFATNLAELQAWAEDIPYSTRGIRYGSCASWPAVPPPRRPELTGCVDEMLGSASQADPRPRFPRLRLHLRLHLSCTA